MSLSEKKRVLLIDVNCKSGSTGKIVYDLYEKLNKDGHTAAIAYGRGVNINEDNIYKFGIDIETKFHALMNRITGIHGSFSPLSTKRLKKFIKEFKPDVIHIHELHGYFVNIVSIMKFIKKLNIKVIWTFHCEYMYEAKGHVYSKLEDPKWNKRLEYPKTYSFDFTKLMVRRYKKAFVGFNDLTITTPSNWLKERTINSNILNYPVYVVHNNYNPNVFYPRDKNSIKEKYNLPIDKKIVLAVAPNIMDEHKGGKYIVKLAELDQLNENLYILIGTTPNDKLVKLNNIKYINRTNNQEELAQYYSVADVTVIPSKRETFSMIALESIACGTPVVGFMSGAPEEIFVNPYGLFSEYGNVELLGENLVKALTKKPNIELYSLFARNNFVENIYKEYFNLYF